MSVFRRFLTATCNKIHKIHKTMVGRVVESITLVLPRYHAVAVFRCPQADGRCVVDVSHHHAAQPADILQQHLHVHVERLVIQSVKRRVHVGQYQ